MTITIVIHMLDNIKEIKNNSNLLLQSSAITNYYFALNLPIAHWIANVVKT